MQESQAILQEHNKHVILGGQEAIPRCRIPIYYDMGSLFGLISLTHDLSKWNVASCQCLTLCLRISCLNTMLALVVQLFTEQSARMKTLEERSNEGPPEVRHSWPIERPLLGNDVRKCGKSGSSNECPEEELNADVRDALLSLWEQLLVLLYYPLDVPWDRILLIMVSVWLLLSRMSSAFGRSSLRMTSPEVEVHEVNPTPKRSNTSKGSSRSAKKERDDTNRTVSGASGRRLQRELQKEMRSSRERRNARAQNDTPRGEARIASRRRRSRSAERERREGERSSSDSSRTDVQRNNLRAFGILCRQLPQTPPLHHRSFLSHRICRFKNHFLQIRLRKTFFRFFLPSIKSMGLVDSELRDPHFASLVDAV